MPKKKLTKAQVKKKLISIQKTLRLLLIDRMDHVGSDVTMTPKMILEIGQKINAATKRVLK